MTPEERQRAMDFIVEHMARFATNMDQLDAKMKELGASFEQERQERLKDQPRIARVEAAFVRIAELVEIESARLDSHEREFFALMNEHEETRSEDRKQAQLKHDEVIAYLKQVLDRLIDRR